MFACSHDPGELHPGSEDVGTPSTETRVPQVPRRPVGLLRAASRRATEDGEVTWDDMG